MRADSRTAGSLERVDLRPNVARTNNIQTAQWWVDAWQQAYDWRADHWGAMPEAKHRKMMRARERGDIAWKREREAGAEPGKTNL